MQLTAIVSNISHLYATVRAVRDINIAKVGKRGRIILISIVLVTFPLLLASKVLVAQSKGTDPSHHIPGAKKLNAEWQKDLYSSSSKPFTGNQLNTIGMPCGGICAGQLYVRGDGTLACWWIANDAYNTGAGDPSHVNFVTALGFWKDCYQTFKPYSYIDQGFTINGRPLDNSGFNAIEFTGEYPVANIAYKDSKLLPYAVTLKTFSPFIPLDTKDSATPGTVLQYTVRNISKTVQKIALSGFLQNMVGIDGRNKFSGTLHNSVYQQNCLTGVKMELTNSNMPEHNAWNGNISLSLIGDGVASAEKNLQTREATASLGQVLDGSVTKNFNLKPGESRTVTFFLTWYFPNRPHYIDTQWATALKTDGPLVYNNYSNWYKSSTDVAEWLATNLSRLQKETFTFVDAYYHHSSLPYWLNRRIMMPMSTLATETCQWWGNEKFWAWEGVGSCIGTCTHVWNYEQGMSHLFPELDKNIRTQTDFANSFRADGGIFTRDGNHDENYGEDVFMDGQCGTVLKAYREHLMSKDNSFLNEFWPKIKMSTQYLIRADGNADGIIEGTQPNTYDDRFFGANTYIGSLYLAALKAAAKMADLENNQSFADSCRAIAEAGKANTTKRLFNGEYFIQDVDLKAHPFSQYGEGCLADQLFGQTWASLYQLGDVYEPLEIYTALNSIWKYNWAPDVASQNRFHIPERDYADPGEAGLFVCTWPHSQHPGNAGVRYRDEVWTGIEYQVATSMIYNGMVKEGLSIIKGLDDRYQPGKHNPWNEIECGDHYARAMASWGVLLALQDFSYNGPEQRMGFVPKLNPDYFESFFTAAESWGNIAQTRASGIQTNIVSVKYGRLDLKKLQLQTANAKPAVVKLSIGGKSVPSQVKQDGAALTITFSPATIVAGQELKVMIKS